VLVGLFFSGAFSFVVDEVADVDVAVEALFDAFAVEFAVEEVAFVECAVAVDVPALAREVVVAPVALVLAAVAEECDAVAVARVVEFDLADVEGGDDAGDDEEVAVVGFAVVVCEEFFFFFLFTFGVFGVEGFVAEFVEFGADERLGSFEVEFGVLFGEVFDELVDFLGELLLELGVVEVAEGVAAVDGLDEDDFVGVVLVEVLFGEFGVDLCGVVVARFEVQVVGVFFSLHEKFEVVLVVEVLRHVEIFVFVFFVWVVVRVV
jgi:hypothetical protein